MPAVMAPEAQFRQTQSQLYFVRLFKFTVPPCGFQSRKKAKNKVYYEQRIDT